MPQVIPFEAEVPYYSFAVVLEGETFVFDVRWNVREAAWYFDIRTPEDDLLAGGIKLALGAAILDRPATEGLPDGVIVCEDTSGAGVEATLDDLGIRVQVLFYSRAEINELRALL